MIPFPIHIDIDSVPALLVGGFLLFCATLLGLKQWWAHRELVLNSRVDEVGYAHTERQIQQRLIVAGLLFLLGVAIPLGDQIDIFFRGHPGLFFAYWMAVLLVVFAMVVLALADVLSTLAYARVSQIKLREERRQIEDEIRRYHASKSSGGSGEPHTSDPTENTFRQG